jgi:hypothetical protein
MLTLKSNNSKAHLKEMTKKYLPDMLKKLSFFSKKKEIKQESPN